MNLIKFICYSTYIFAFCTSILPNDPLVKNSSYDEPITQQESYVDSKDIKAVGFQETMENLEEDFLCEKPLYELENLDFEDLDSYED